MLRYLFRSMRSTLGTLAQDRRGNVAMMFALTVVPIIGLVGAAVDYSRATDVRQTLNAAIESAALMAARDASKLTDSQLRTRVDGWIRAQLQPDWSSSFSGATVAIDRTARTVNITANVEVQATLMRVLGQTTMAIGSNAQSSWGNNTIELALVLDNTGSMASSGKMTALKEASKQLIKIMQDATETKDQIRISVVPFVTQVKLDKSNSNASWLRYGLQRTTCRTVVVWQVCDVVETMTNGVWDGCITDRDMPNDTTDTPATSFDTRYPADWCATDVATILPLTSNWTQLNKKIDDMNPNGATNVTIGAIWGMATLSPSEPFTEAKPSTTPRLRKFMILLTDGDNTKNRWWGNGSSPDSRIDARTQLACTSIKNSGVTLYTIRVIDGNASMLRDCASDPSLYKEVKTASELKPVFEQIAKEISAVRLTQ